MCTIPTVTVDMCPSNQRPTTTITAMVAAGRNGHMAPRMRPFVPHQCVRLIDDDPQASRNTFYGDWKSFWLIVLFGITSSGGNGNGSVRTCSSASRLCRPAVVIIVSLSCQLLSPVTSFIRTHRFCVYWRYFCCRRWRCHSCGRCVVDVAAKEDETVYL